MRWIAFSQKGALEGRGVVSGVGVMAIFQGEYSSLGNLDKAVPHPAESSFRRGWSGCRWKGPESGEAAQTGCASPMTGVERPAVAGCRANSSPEFAPG